MNRNGPTPMRSRMYLMTVKLTPHTAMVTSAATSDQRSTDGLATAEAVPEFICAAQLTIRPFGCPFRVRTHAHRPCPGARPRRLEDPRTGERGARQSGRAAVLGRRARRAD